MNGAMAYLDCLERLLMGALDSWLLGVGDKRVVDLWSGYSRDKVCTLENGDAEVVGMIKSLT
jgi:hypothetical protein